MWRPQSASAEAAHSLFRTVDSNRWVEEDTLLARLSLARNLLGLAVVVTVALVTEGVGSSEFNPLTHLLSLLAGVVSTVVAVLAVGVFLLVVTRSGARGRAALRLLVPARTMLVYLAAVLAPFLIGIYGWRLIFSFHAGVLLTLLMGVLLFGLVVPLALVAAVGTRDSVKSLFRAAEGHPLLAPVATVVLVWLQPRFVLLLQQADGPDTLPKLLLFYGGPVVVTLLSLFEVARLGGVPDVDLRGGPPAEPVSRPAGAPLGVPVLACVSALVGGLVVTGTAMLLINASLQQHPTGAPVALNLTVAPGDLDAGRVSADGKTVVVTTGGDTTYLYSSTTSELLTSWHLDLGSTSALAMSPDGRLVAVAGNAGAAGRTHGTPVLLWSVPDHRIVSTLPLPAGQGDTYVADLAFSSDGTRLLAAVHDSPTVCQWKVTAAGADQAPSTFKAPDETGQDVGVVRVAYVDGDRMIALSTGNGTYLVDAATGAVTATGTYPVAGSFALSADGRTMALPVALPGNPGFADAVQLWNVSTHTVERTLTVPGTGRHTAVSALALNDNGSLLAGGDATGRIYIWDIGTGRLVTTIRNQSGYLDTHLDVTDDTTTLQQVPRTSLLLSTDSIGKVTLWNLAALPGPRSWAGP
ncbi:WD40 repeat domain-containing protein [Kitasatospora sp. NPDC058965]|uniref:WD40 repeat domain-containing protein n=1 Tax=Kitasatospora sp. NPDC058965 TaxID=3346682 RepID=UPI003687C586